MKNYTQALREVKGAYTEKNHFSLEVNTAILEALILNFRAKGIKFFGPFKTKKFKFSFIPFVPRLMNINFVLTNPYNIKRKGYEKM